MQKHWNKTTLIMGLATCWVIGCGSTPNPERVVESEDEMTRDELLDIERSMNAEDFRKWLWEEGYLKKVGLSKDSTEEVGEIGQLRERLFIDRGFGSEFDSAITPCDPADGFAGGLCLAPSGALMRTTVVNVCRFENRAGCSFEAYTDMVDNAITTWERHTVNLSLEGGGWEWGSSPQVRVQIIPTQSGPLGSTVVVVNDLIPGLLDDIEECNDFAGGQFCTYNNATVLINVRAVASNEAYAAADSGGKALFIQNVVNHELGHVAGLGHFTGALQLMTAGSDSAIHQAFTERPFAPTPLQMQMMCRYNPNQRASVPFQPCRIESFF